MALQQLLRGGRPGARHPNALRNAVASGKIVHAYLFCGPRGTGKTSTARILAKAVNCLDPQEGEPCNRCASCTAMNEGRAIDLIEIDAASNRGIDDARELQREDQVLARRSRATRSTSSTRPICSPPRPPTPC